MSNVIPTWQEMIHATFPTTSPKTYSDRLACRYMAREIELLRAALTSKPQATESELVEALQKHEEISNEMFGFFCSNGMYNRWGNSFDCTKLNEAHYLTSTVLKKYGFTK